MNPEQPLSSFYRARAAIYAWCASRAVSPETAAALLYLEQLWADVAEIAAILEGPDRAFPAAATLGDAGRPSQPEPLS